MIEEEVYNDLLVRHNVMAQHYSNLLEFCAELARDTEGTLRVSRLRMESSPQRRRFINVEEFINELTEEYVLLFAYPEGEDNDR